MKDSGVSTRAITEDIKQNAPLRYDSFISLYSTVIGSGNPTVFKYSKVNDIRVWWNSSNTGFHYQVSSYSYAFSTDKKQCIVTLSGYPQNAAGLILTVSLTDTIRFSAN